MDIDAKMSAGYAMNKMGWSMLLDPRNIRLINALGEAYDAL
jgi:hypothetical protein